MVVTTLTTSKSPHRSSPDERLMFVGVISWYRVRPEGERAITIGSSWYRSAYISRRTRAVPPRSCCAGRGTTISVSSSCGKGRTPLLQRIGGHDVDSQRSGDTFAPFSGPGLVPGFARFGGKHCAR